MGYFLYQEEYFLTSSEILGTIREVPVVSWVLAQHTIDKSLRAMNLHTSSAILFLVHQFSNTNNNINI